MVSRGVLKPPGSAARGLITWADDLWPYVNGKALANGLKLVEMESSEMLDVLHYYFEDDIRYASAETAEAVTSYRTQLYLLYGKTYKYGTSASSSSNRNYVPKGASDDLNLDDLPGSTSGVKPYIPPTEFNPDSFLPFGSTLESPLN